MTLNELAKKHGVASLDLSKELEKAGMPQDKNIYYYVETSLTGFNDYPIFELSRYRENTKTFKTITREIDYPKDAEHYAAFHATELADVLPPFCLGGKTPDGGFNCWKFDDMCHRNIEHYNSFQTDTLPNALAKMVLYLLEKKILKKEDL